MEGENKEDIFRLRKERRTSKTQFTEGSVLLQEQPHFWRFTASPFIFNKKMGLQ